MSGLDQHPDDRDPDAPDEFDAWENAGRYLPNLLYPTLRPEHRAAAGREPNDDWVSVR